LPLALPVLEDFDMKLPTYTPRDLAAFANADRVVCRAWVDGDWKEVEFFPEPGQSVRDRLAITNHALRHHKDFSKVMLYVGGLVDGILVKASVRHGEVPVELQR
jgi:hypothetical protein